VLERRRPDELARRISQADFCAMAVYVYHDTGRITKPIRLKWPRDEIEPAIRRVAAERDLVVSMTWRPTHDLYDVTLRAPWLSQAGVHHRITVSLANQLVHHACYEQRGLYELAKYVDDAGKLFWEHANWLATTGCYPGHAPPAPDSPAGLYAAAFG